eukprot:s5948_g4.t1
MLILLLLQLLRVLPLSRLLLSVLTRSALASTVARFVYARGRQPGGLKAEVIAADLFSERYSHRPACRRGLQKVVLVLTWEAPMNCGLGTSRPCCARGHLSVEKASSQRNPVRQ